MTMMIARRRGINSLEEEIVEMIEVAILSDEQDTHTQVLLPHNYRGRVCVLIDRSTIDNIESSETSIDRMSV